MAKHRAFNAKGKEHVAIKQLGSLIIAARVHPNGVWAMAQGIWESKLRRAANV